MEKIVRLTESDLVRIVRRVINEEAGDVKDPKTHFDTVINALVPMGFTKSEYRNNGVTMVFKDGKGGGDVNGIYVNYVFPGHEYSKEAGYVVSLRVTQNKKVLYSKKWKSGEVINMNDIVALVKKYNTIVFS